MDSEISLLDLCMQRNAVADMGDFDTLGAEFQTAECARYWLDCKLGMSSNSPKRGAEYFRQIPDQLRTYAVCETLVSRYPLNLGLVDHQLERYSSLVIIALRRESTSQVLGLVHPNYQTTTMIHQLLADRSSAQSTKAILECDWSRESMTPELITFACTQTVDYALKADKIVLSDDALAALATHQINGYNKIRDAGRFDLLVKPLSQGYWPKSNRVTGSLEKPAGLANSFRLLLSARSEDEEALYMAYMMTYPIEKVMKVLSGPRGGRFLMEMYTSDELRPYLKEASLLVRGKVLEAELGM